MLSVISNLFSGNFSEFIQGYILWGAIFGIIGADIAILGTIIQWKYTPSRLAMDGWQYNFKYNDSPLTLLKKNFLEKGLREGKYYDEQGAPVGLLEEPVSKRVAEIDDNKESLRKYNPEIVYRSYHEAVRQTIVTGQTGSGKSVAMLSLMYNDIVNNIPLCVVDFKKSGDMLYFLSKWAKDNGRPFYYFTNGDGIKNDFYGEQATYDPLSTGDQTSRADFILNLREWDASADVYKQRTQEILQGVIYALMITPHSEAKGIDWDSGILKQLIASLDLKNMYDLVSYLSKRQNDPEMTQTEKLRIENFISNFKEISDSKSQTGRALREQLSGIKTVINKLIMSSYGKWLMKGNSKKHIDLLKFSTDKKYKDKSPIVLFAFSSQEEPDFAKSMGQVIMSDLNRVSAAKTDMNDKSLYGVYVDEFQTLNPKFVANLLSKARSAGFFITIASQSLEQISASATENSDATLQSILDVCGNYLFLKGAKQDSAERMAKILGQTRHISRHVTTKSDSGVFKFNFFNSHHGIVNKATNDDWILSPSKFQSLKDSGSTDGKYSEAYFISSSKDSNNRINNAAHRVKIIAQQDILPGPSPEFEDFISKQTFSRINDSISHDDNSVDTTEIKTDSFAALKTAHKVNRDTLPKIDKKDQLIKSSSTTKDNVIVKSDPIPNKESDVDSSPKHKMTTFERIQAEQKKATHANKEKHKPNFDTANPKVDDSDFPGRTEPELLSRSIEFVPNKKRLKLPKRDIHKEQ